MPWLGIGKPTQPQFHIHQLAATDCGKNIPSYPLPVLPI